MREQIGASELRGRRSSASTRSRSARATPTGSWSAIWNGAGRSGSAARTAARRAWTSSSISRQKEDQRIRLAVMDMWKAFRNSTTRECAAGRHPVRQVPRDEAPRRGARQGPQGRIRALSGKQRQFIKGQKYTLLSHPQNLKPARRGRTSKLLLAANKRLNTAYLLKESFGQLWDYNREPWARKFFENWSDELEVAAFEAVREVCRDDRASTGTASPPTANPRTRSRSASSRG